MKTGIFIPVFFFAFFYHSVEGDWCRPVGG
nr:MAG TPA: hypothetical protein [Bacteriophage sp.]